MPLSFAVIAFPFLYCVANLTDDVFKVDVALPI